MARLRLFLVVIILCLLCPAAALRGQSQTNTAVPRFDTIDCPFEVPANVRCGVLVVREDRADPTSRTIRLMVAILKSKNPAPAPDPILYLEGGPGGSAIAYLPGWFDSPILEKRDLIVLEQRGVNFSEPRLACPEVARAMFANLAVNLNQQEEVAYEVQAAAQCRDRLKAAGVNPAAYNSAASAADVEDLRQLLGYAQWNLYSVSYGTRLALTVIRDWPKGLRSVVLDSAYPPQAKSYDDRLANAANAFDKLFAACAADPACNMAYPDLKNTFYGMLERLDTHPIPVTTTNPSTGQPMTLQIAGGDISGMLFLNLYSAAGVRYSPFFIDQLSRGNASILMPIAQQAFTIFEAIDWGLFYSVECNERASFSSADAISTSVRAYPDLASFLASRSDMDICAIWGAGTPAAIENQPVRGDVPTLILAGEFDPTTPPRWGKAASETLSHAYYYQFTGLSHAVSFESGCGQSMTLRFFDDPTTAPDSTCMAEFRAPAFVLPGDVYLTPAPFRLESELLGQHDLGQLALLGLCLTLFLAELPLWLLSLLHALTQLLRRRRATSQLVSRPARIARLLAALVVLLNLVFLLELVIALGQTLATDPALLGFGVPTASASIFWIPRLAAVLMLPLPIFAVLGWRNRWWSAVGRMRYTLLTAAIWIFTFWLIHWDLLRF